MRFWTETSRFALAMLIASWLVACVGTLEPDPSIEDEAAVVAAESSGNHCEPKCGPCAGSTVAWKFGTRPVDEWGRRRTPGTATSAVSLADCFAMLDGFADLFCSQQGLPGDCAGTCQTGTCSGYGEATDEQGVPSSPGKFSCKATAGKCACKCK